MAAGARHAHIATQRVSAAFDNARAMLMGWNATSTAYSYAGVAWALRGSYDDLLCP